MKIDKDTLMKDYKDNKFTGYIWMVSSQRLIIYENETINFSVLYNKDEPYNKIQEAYLFDGTNSIHIKNIDGIELIYVHKEDDFNNDKFKIDTEWLELPSHIIKGKNLLFKQVYQLQDSISDGDFKTYQPVVRLFKGFSNSKNN